jgi:anti-sigma factor RsiW
VYCQEISHLLHGFIDGELDLVTSLSVEQHLGECPVCAQICRNQQALQAALRSAPRAFSPPPGLRRRIRSAIRRSHGPLTVRYRLRWRQAVLAASLVFVLVLAWALSQLVSLVGSSDRIAQELTANHVRSLMLPDHQTDVLSTDQHTVKPWFNGKVDFSPQVLNPEPNEYPLMGGRLEWLNNRPVAAVVYHHRKHLINLYTWPASSGADEPVTRLQRQGFNLAHWTQAGMTYWVISDVNAEDLQKFVRMLQQRQQ